MRRYDCFSTLDISEGMWEWGERLDALDPALVNGNIAKNNIKPFKKPRYCNRKTGLA